MPFSLDDFMAQAGTSRNTVAENPAFNNSAGVGQVQAKQPGFWTNIAHSAMTIPGQVIGAAGQALGKAFTDTAGGISEALTSGAQNNANLQYQQALDDAGRKYSQMYADGKLSKAAYTKLSSDLIKQGQSLSGDISKDVNNMVAPGDFASGLATVASLPFAFGGLAPSQALARAAEAGGAVGKLAQAGQVAERLGGVKAAAQALHGPDFVAGADGVRAAQAADKAIAAVQPTTLKSSIGAIAKAPVKAALIDAPVANAPVDIAKDLKHGNYGDAALTAGAFAVPGALHAAGKAVAPIIKDAMFGKSAILGDAFGHARVNDFVKTATPEQLRTLKQMEMYTASRPDVVNGDVNPGQALAQHLQERGIDPKTAPLVDIIKNQDAYAGAVKTVEGARDSIAAKRASDIAQNKVATVTAKAINAEAAAKAQTDMSGAAAFDKALGIKSKPITSEPVPTVKPNLVKVTPDLPANAVVTAKVSDAIPAVVKGLQTAGDRVLSLGEKAKIAEQAMNDAGVKNGILRSQIIDALIHPASELNTGNDMAKAVKPIIQKFEINHPDVKLPKGFTMTLGPNERAVLPTDREVARAGAPILGHDANPVIATAMKGLDRVGFGITATDKGAVKQALTSALDKRLEQQGIQLRGKDVIDGLNGALNKTQGVYDPRLLRVAPRSIGPAGANIADALGVTPQDAAKIKTALKGAYADIPLGLRSGGEKLVDKTLNTPVIGNAMGTYLKAQGYGRFTLNPVFWAKQAAKGEFIGQAETGGKAVNLGQTLNKLIGTAPSDETMKALSDEGKFSKAQMAGGGHDLFGNLASETAKDNLDKNQVNGYIRQTMGQAAEKFAANNGTTVKSIMSDNGPLKSELDRLLQMVVGYPKDGYLQSNMAKSLNVLVFPSRFETKVGMAAAHYLTSQPPIVQGALVQGLLNAKSFLDSPQGKQWQKDNSELIGAINYFSPTHTLDSVMKTLGSGNLGDLGAVGGMPFGVITTILKNQGVPVPDFMTGGAGEDPKTGLAYTQHLPNTTKARWQQGLTDLIGSLFSYPGKTVGLTGKNQLIQDVVPGLKINPKEQTTVKAPNGPSIGKTSSAEPSTITAPKNFNPNPQRIHSNVQPIYKNGVPHGARAKVHARKPT